MPRMLGWALLLLCARVVSADPRSATVQVLSFPEGPTVLLAPDSLAGSVHVGLWYPAGSRNDPPTHAGLAYVLGRSAFTLPATARRALDATGANYDLTVTPDFTSNSVVLPPDQLRAGLEAVLPLIQAPAITDASLHDAISGARAERTRRLAQSPLLLGIERVCASLFVGHGYAAPASGLDAALAATTLDAARHDLATRFTPAHALVTVTGRFDPDDALAALKPRFGSPGRAAPASKPQPPSFGDVVPRSNAGATALPVSVVLAGWRLPPDRDPDTAALQVLARLLTQGASPRLERELVTGDGPFLQTQGNFERRGDACLFVVAAALRGTIDSTQVESQLTSQVERWAHDPIAAADLEPAQRAVEAELLLAAQTTAGRAETLASAQIVDGDWRAWEQRIARVRALTPADVQRAASRSLVPSRRAIVWTAPAPAGGRTP